MSLYCVLRLILTFFYFKVVLSSTHDVIGNYSHFNSKDCGLTRFATELGVGCFKWPKSKLDKILFGRDAMTGEAPWIVNVMWQGKDGTIWSCDGSLISDQWVLTAAHCLRYGDPDSYRIVNGTKSLDYNDNGNYEVLELHPYPHYRHATSDDIKFFEVVHIDIGLIKLKTPVEKSDAFHTICLPERDIFNSEIELALVAGFGIFNYSKIPAPHLQIGYTQIRPSYDFSVDVSQYFILNDGEIRYNKTHTCVGDSGSPIWQYSGQRAVVIGVNSLTFGYSYPCTSSEEPTLFIRVSKFIDWIMNVTKLK